VNQVSELIGNLGGTVQRTDNWGKRRLAYEVDRIRDGHYVLTDFQIDQPRIPELESTLRISDQVFRFIVVRKPPQSKRAAAQQRAASADGAGTAQPAEQQSEVQPAAASAAQEQPAPAAEEEAQV
jgi:small subunit ribosomal protein S6